MPTIYGTKLNIYNSPFTKSAIFNTYKRKLTLVLLFPSKQLYIPLFTEPDASVTKNTYPNLYILLNRFNILVLWGKNRKSKQTTQTTLNY